MLCEKCQNEYPSIYFFATPTICKRCFSKLPIEEQNKLANIQNEFKKEQSLELRVSFSKRFFASLIDMVILIVIILLFYNSVGFFDAYSNMLQEIKEIAGDRQAIKEFQEEFFRSNATNLAFPVALNLIYFLSEAIAGVSFGKYILGLRIGSLRGEKASKKSLWIRYLVKNSSGIITLLWLVLQSSFLSLLNSILVSTLYLGFFLILGRNRQNIQDIIAGTAVYMYEDLEETTDKGDLLIK